ncbi:hypothetical protein ENSA5_13470 [Enhygromyxa salina]|uniref:Prepilin-type N-terminal cleavage/methylation domain-containing protein n=1 Tax=Enhygromyxa salina TaxID=215803 RepID=A0A2S9YEU6_9BACT|nr:prepilin-type N-terminal cleavage/methylation domain-containing protein [Enhygromyxa salina]PRQ03654.1 hypothetical protein ENSA5_13470 [Enhygromyxa salina]
MPGRPPPPPPRPAPQTLGQTGFTLLEVLIALAILAVSLSSLMNSQMNSMAATSYARDITAVALLAERQIVELEFKHREEGWVSSDVEFEGDFSDEGYDDIDWLCTVHFIELPEYNQLIESKEGADEASGASDDNMVDAGDQAFGALGLVWPIVKAAIENSIRKVDCTLSWEQGTIEQEFTIQTFWTDPTALQNLPGAGGEFSDEDDDSGASEEGTSGSSATGTGSGGMLPPSRGGSSSGGLNMGGN